MPKYGSPQGGGVLTALSPGDSMFLFQSTEVIAAPQASIAFSRGVASPGPQPSGTVFTMDWAAAPTAVVEIQGSNRDVDADYQTLFTSTGIQHDYYNDLGEFAFYRAVLVSSAGGTPDVIAQR